MGKLSLEERVSNGQEAKRLLASPMFTAVINALVADQMQSLMATTPGSEAGISAHAMLKGLNEVKNGLKRLENDGVMADKELRKQP